MVLSTAGLLIVLLLIAILAVLIINKRMNMNKVRQESSTQEHGHGYSDLLHLYAVLLYSVYYTIAAHTKKGLAMETPIR